MEGLISADSLPSADFSIADLDSEEEQEEEGPVTIFTRTGSKPVTGGDTETRNHINEQDIVVHDIETDDKKDEDQFAKNGNEIPKSRDEDQDKEWNEFQSQFYSVLESSETMVQEATLTGQLQRLKDDLLSSGLLNTSSANVRLTVSPDHKATRLIGTGTDERHDKTSETGSGSSHLLQSSCFDQINEDDLDMMLEVIKEEAESREATPTKEEGSSSFEWQPLVSTNQELMSQLESASVLNEAQVEEYRSILRSSSSFKEDKKSKYSEPDNQNVIHLDLRPTNTMHFDTESHDEMSSSAKRLMALRLSGNKSSVGEEEEESYDAHSWKIERRKFKNTSSSSGGESDTKASQPVPVLEKTLPVPNETSILPPPSSSKKTPPSSSLVPSPRTRLTSSESVSEDDVFSSPSQEGLAGPENSSQGGGGGAKSKQDGKSKRRKHKGCGRNDSGSGSENENKRRQKGRGRKDSGSSSDGEGKGKKKKSQDSKKDANKQQKSRKSLSHRDRKDSLTQSSDDDSILSFKGSPPTLPPPGRSLSEGDAESVVKSLERVKSFLQQKIELRKPPSLFNVPNTSPLFHQDVSFSDPLLSFHPSLTDTQSLLLLPLTENGLIDMDTVDLPSHTLSISVTHLLHTILITWLISLMHTTSPEGKEEETDGSAVLWRPFIVNGLQQTVVDGLPCILVTITSTGSCEITQLLSSSSLAQIINPLMTILNLTSFNENTLSQLHSLSTTPLSCLLSLQTDSSLISTPLSFYSHTFYSLRCLPSADSIHSTAPLQRTVCTISHTNLSNTRVVFNLLYEATTQGLDIVGLRLVYDTTTNKHFPLAPLKEREIANEKTEETPGQGSPVVIHKSHTIKQELCDDSSFQLVLVVSFRGPNAISRIIDIIGPDDHSLALITDPASLSAQYGGGNSSPNSTSSKGVPLVSCVRNSYWGGLELAKWFGGRACLKSGSIIGVSDAITKSERRKRQRVRFSESESEDVVIPLPEDIDYPPLISNRPALLVYPYSRVILVASPLVGPSCYSTLLSSVSEAGFDLLGIKRIRLNPKRALSLNIPMPSISHFTPSSSSSSPMSPSLNDNALSFSSSQSESGFPPLPSLLLILARENASSHIQFLLNTVTSSLRNLSASNPNILDPSLPSSGLLHVTDFSEDALKVIGSYTFTPSSSSGAKPSPLLLEDKSYKEEISLIAVSGTHSLTDALDTLDSLTAISRPNKASTHSTNNSLVSSSKPVVSRDEEGLGGFELLGIKIVPSLSRFQAKQLCPYPQSSAGFSEMVDSLFAKPVLLLLVRGISCNERVWKLLKGSDNYDILLGSRKSTRIICSDDFNKAFYLSTLFFIDKELFSDSDVWPWAHLVPPAWINDCAILSSLSVDPEPLLSVFTVAISHMTLLVKVLEKLSRSGFHFVGMKLTEGDQSDKFVVAVCVERYNAVWYLAHQLQLFTHSSNSYSKAIYYSPTFMSAVADVQFYFPCGSVHTLSSALLKYYQVSSDPSVSTGPFSPRSKVTSTPYEGLTPPTSPLSEDAYLILPPSYLSSPSASSSSSYACLSFIIVLDVLTRAGFSLTDILMTQLSRKMAQELLLLVDTKLKEDDLYKDGPDVRPCIVIGVRRDNAASCFQSIISNFLLHCSVREDTVSIGRIFDGLIVTGTAQQTSAVQSVFKNTQSQPEQ